MKTINIEVKDEFGGSGVGVDVEDGAELAEISCGDYPGERGAFSLTKAQAEQLGEFLLAWARS